MLCENYRITADAHITVYPNCSVGDSDIEWATVNGDSLCACAVLHVARNWQSSGTIGSELARLASTERAYLPDLARDMESTAVETMFQAADVNWALDTIGGWVAEAREIVTGTVADLDSCILLDA